MLSYLLLSINKCQFFPIHQPHSPQKKGGNKNYDNKELEKLSEKNDKVAICFNSENKQNANLL